MHPNGDALAAVIPVSAIFHFILPNTINASARAARQLTYWPLICESNLTVMVGSSRIARFGNRESSLKPRPFSIEQARPIEFVFVFSSSHTVQWYSSNYSPDNLDCFNSYCYSRRFDCNQHADPYYQCYTFCHLPNHSNRRRGHRYQYLHICRCLIHPRIEWSQSVSKTRYRFRSTSRRNRLSSSRIRALLVWQKEREVTGG